MTSCSGEGQGGRERPVDPVAASVAVYGDHAEQYAADHAAKMLDRVERFASHLPSRSEVLDAGCGPGRDLARFSALGHDVFGVDLNPAFVSMATAHAPAVRGDLREIASLFPAARFDGIWAAASLVHLSAPETVDVLGQFARLLRPGGKLYVAVRATGDTGWLDEPDGRRWYTVWEPAVLVCATERAGFTVDDVTRGVFVEVWATRDGVGSDAPDEELRGRLSSA